MVDDEEVDSTMIGTYVANESKVLTTPGYTQHILNVLRNDELIVFVGGQKGAATIGRCSATVLGSYEGLGQAFSPSRPNRISLLQHLCIVRRVCTWQTWGLSSCNARGRRP